MSNPILLLLHQIIRIFIIIFNIPTKFIYSSLHDWHHKNSSDEL